MKSKELTVCPGSGMEPQTTKPLRRESDVWVDQARCPECNHFLPRKMSEAMDRRVPEHAL